MTNTTTSDKPGSVAEALVQFQARMPVVHKAQTARVPTKSGGEFTYSYADLADVMAAALPLLNELGLSFACLPRQTEGGGYELAGRLLHSSGDYIEGCLPLQGRQAQELGSSLTYARRYLLGAMTGIVTDDDDDGARANDAKRATVDRGPAARRVWARAQESTRLEDVKSLWAEANAEGLLPVTIEHMDGAPEPLGDALKRYGDMLASASP